MNFGMCVPSSCSEGEEIMLKYESLKIALALNLKYLIFPF